MTGLIVHEWVEFRGGSENVLEVLADTFPDAPVLVPWSNAPERLKGHHLVESRLSRTPLRRSKPLAALVLPVAWRTMVPRRRSFDWVLASSHLFSHHVRASGPVGDAPKFVYVHSPARYIWDPELDARGRSAAARSVGAVLKPLDRRRAGEARRIAANSRHVRDRVRRNWGRDAEVIHPPVDVDRVRELATTESALREDERALRESLPDQFLLGASRFVPYKRLETVIRAGEVAGLPVVIAGAGSEEAALRARAATASVPVRFVIAPSDAALAVLYTAAAALVFPAVEDFGIMPVEAMAVGTPVVAPRVGGTGESVLDGRTGALLDGLGDSDLRNGVDAALALDGSAAERRADEFAPSVFRDRIRRWMQAGLSE